MINACERRKVECGQEVHVGARQEDLGLGNRKKWLRLNNCIAFMMCWKFVKYDGCIYPPLLVTRTSMLKAAVLCFWKALPPPAQLTPRKWGTLSWVPLLQALLGSVSVLLVANFWRSASTEEGSQEKMLLHVPEPLRLSLSLRIWKSLEVPSLHIFAPLWSLGPKSQSLRWWFSICVWRSARFGTQCRAVVSWNTEGT